MRRRLLLLLGLFALSGCALLGKSDPFVPRYFTPEYEGAAPTVPARSDLRLRLGRVEGSSHLHERMAARSSAREVTYSEDRRWTERPEIYLRRALARALFEERGVIESLSGRAITLDVELLAFEEVEQPHAARLQALLVLRDDRVGLLAETITAEQPIAKNETGDQALATVEAFSRALNVGVTRMADRVVAKLAEQEVHAAK